MKKYSILLALFFLSVSASRAQATLSLDSLRNLALANNKTVAIGREQVNKANYTQKAAHTNFFPKIALTGGYLHTGESVSLLTKDQKGALSHLGTNVTTALMPSAEHIIQRHPDLAPLLTPMMQQMGGSLNQAGQGIVDALETNTRNVAAGAIVLTQPLYMGGKIRAYDRITKYAEQVAGQQLRSEEQEVVLSVDQAYWQVVSLANKKKLAQLYRDMQAQMNDDVQKMIDEGVATRASGLNVDVKLGEAEMTLLKVDDGLTLSRMLLCQLCGLPLDEEFLLADERLADLPSPSLREAPDLKRALALRPELESLRLAADIYGEKVKIERSSSLPQLALMGGYGAMTPSLFNGFENKFRGTWSVGVTLAVPVWNWGEGRYKVRAAKADVAIAKLRLEDAQEKIGLQVKQAGFRVNEAEQRLALSQRNVRKAEENLRTAELGFKEGVIATSDMLAAQTAWVAAQSEKIDAQIDVRLANTLLGQALGTLR